MRSCSPRGSAKAATVRERTCERLAFLGVSVDPAKNAVAEPRLRCGGADDSSARVLVIRAREDLVAAQLPASSSNRHPGTPRWEIRTATDDGQALDGQAEPQTKEEIMKILLAYDGFQRSKRALEETAELASGGEVEVTILSVVPEAETRASKSGGHRFLAPHAHRTWRLPTSSCGSAGSGPR